MGEVAEKEEWKWNRPTANPKYTKHLAAPPPPTGELFARTVVWCGGGAGPPSNDSHRSLLVGWLEPVASWWKRLHRASQPM